MECARLEDIQRYIYSCVVMDLLPLSFRTTHLKKVLLSKFEERVHKTKSGKDHFAPFSRMLHILTRLSL